MPSHRGRPSVFQRECGEMADQMMAVCVDPEKTKRASTNAYYAYMGVGVIKEAASEIPEYEMLYDPVNRKLRCLGVLEQLGRMLIQDGYSRESVISIAKAAAGARADGVRSKDIERYIAHGRRTGEWS